jgi:pimeloyl-ACP methyl ester carboxylesterase
LKARDKRKEIEARKMSVSFLRRENAPALAYQRTKGENTNLPTVVFLTGFRSDMQGTKAAFLQSSCARRGQACLLFDYRAHGWSEGVFEKATIGLWLEDALDVIDNLCEGRVLLVGSSMGGWIGLCAALLRTKRVAGFIGIAAAPDFTRYLPDSMNEEQKVQLATQGFFNAPTPYDDRPYIITRNLLEEGENHCLLDAAIPIACPVRLIQGMKDPDVPWQTAHRIANAIPHEDKKVYLREDGDHRLSKEDDLTLLEKLMMELSKN